MSHSNEDRPRGDWRIEFFLGLSGAAAFHALISIWVGDFGWLDFSSPEEMKEFNMKLRELRELSGRTSLADDPRVFRVKVAVELTAAAVMSLVGLFLWLRSRRQRAEIPPE